MTGKRIPDLLVTLFAVFFIFLMADPAGAQDRQGEDETRGGGQGARNRRGRRGASVELAKEFVWETDLEAALAKAREMGKPLLISMHSSTERACQRMLTEVYTDPEVRAKLAHFVVIPTCPDTHEEIFSRVDGREQRVSVLFETVSCQALIKNEKDVYARFIDTVITKVPSHVFIGLDGKVFMTKNFELKKDNFIKLLDNALVAFGSKKINGLSDQVQAYFRQIKIERGKKREEAVKAVLQLNVEEVYGLLYPTIQSLKNEKDRAECIRAMGYRQFNGAAPLVVHWLTDKSTFIKNCAVVTLEEMEATMAQKLLLDLFPRTRDSELQKDILRALGPCGAGNSDAKALLMSQVKSKQEKMRLACYLSLGYFLDDDKVLSLMKERYKKEGRNTLLKIGIIWAFQQTRDAGLAVEIEGLVEKDKNHQINLVAESVINMLKRTPGRNARGVGRAAGRAGNVGGTNRELRQVTQSLYADDKIMRNVIKDRMENQQNNRKAGGGAGR